MSSLIVKHFVHSTRPKERRALICLRGVTMSQSARHFSERQIGLLKGWDTLFQRLLTSAIFSDSGQDPGAQEVALGLACDQTAQAVVDTWEEAYSCVKNVLQPFIEAKRTSLAYFPPLSAQ